MVARIKIGSSLSRAFYYNENKVKEGVSNCIAAENFPIRMERMTEVKRLDILKKTASLRPGLKANSVHISLNFAPTEQFSDDRLKEIATVYMNKIGFGQQPFLVYRHHDAGHPHVHIVTTKVTMDGSVINTNNIGKVQSEKARKEIEISYGLIRAEDQPKQQYELKPAFTEKVSYGKTESRKAIAAVLAGVIKTYKYSSLAELNAVLKLYNVVADPGSDKSRTFANNGLHYKVLDMEGNPVGVPIKASAIAGNPGLKFLEDQFRRNEPLKTSHKIKVKNAIDFYFIGAKPSLPGLTAALKKEGIDVVLRASDQGQLYGITYVDHRNKCVFNGSKLGKQYSAKSIADRCIVFPAPSSQKVQPIILKQRNSSHFSDADHPEQEQAGLLQQLLQPEVQTDYVPYELSGRKKKKKIRRKIN